MSTPSKQTESTDQLKLMQELKNIIPPSQYPEGHALELILIAAQACEEKP